MKKAAAAAEMTVGERGQVVIPKSIRTQLGIKPKMKLLISTKDGSVQMKPQHDLASFDAAFKKWRGTGRKRLLAAGYKDVDDFIEAIRGR